MLKAMNKVVRLTVIALIFRKEYFEEITSKSDEKKNRCGIDQTDQFV